jgi:hypothetical protein
MIDETYGHPTDASTLDSSTDEFESVESSQGAGEQWERTRQACYDQDLLARGWRRNECVTKPGRKLIEAAALVDQEVAGAFQDALNEPVTRRTDAYVSVLLLAHRRFSWR